MAETGRWHGEVQHHHRDGTPLACEITTIALKDEANQNSSLDPRMTGSVGGKIKEEGTTHWDDPNTGATNISGFTAVGGGYRYNYGNFRQRERSGAYWTSTLYEDTQRALTRRLDYNNTFIDRDYNNSYNAASVRCVKDEE